MLKELFKNPGLSLERLHTLILVAKAGSISAASAGNPTLQSQYSRQIKDLGEFFGVALLEDGERRKRLNEHGRELAKLAQLSLESLAVFKRSTQGQAERYVIGAGDSLIQWKFLPKFSEIQQVFEGAGLVFKNLTTQGVAEGLLDGSLHLALIDNRSAPGECKTLASFEYGFRLVVPQTLLEGKTSRQVDTLLGTLPLSVMEGRGQMRRNLEQRIQKKGLDMDIRLECTSYPQIAVAVRAGEVAGVLPDYAMPLFDNPQDLERFTILPIPESKRRVTAVVNPKTLEFQPRLSQDLSRLAKLLVR